MKNHITTARATLHDGCDRAIGLKSIFDFLKKTAPAALNCDDILRSSLLLSVSSLDLFIHDIFRLEIKYRLTERKEVNSFRIPFNILVSDEQKRIDLIDESIRQDNAYKSFVAPDKVAECLRPLLENPWERIAKNLPINATEAKSKLRRIVDLRNRIAHEADVNPEYGGIELWPIYAEDVDLSINYIRSLGDAICITIDES